MIDLHDGPAGGHFSGDTTTHKIIKAEHYCPTLFKYAHAHVKYAHALDFLGPAWWAGWQGGLSSLAAKVFQEAATTGAFQKWANTGA